MMHIVLVMPDIPQNTGTIGRLCVCTGARLHLIRPLGFSLDASRVRSAGLDYWKWVDLKVHDDWESFLKSCLPERLFFCSTKASKNIYQTSFSDGDYLVFGSETRGLPDDFHEHYAEQLVTIPMPGQHARSHNLANAVSIVLYEALRQNLWMDDSTAARCSC